MTEDEVAERVARLPNNEAIGTALERSGFVEKRETLARAHLEKALRAKPSLVESWRLWSMDQRTTTGWVFDEANGRYVVYFFAAGEPDSTKMNFEDPITACAEYALRVAGWIADIRKSR